VVVGEQTASREEGHPAVVFAEVWAVGLQIREC
jgi:hypothetical protein